MGRYYRIQITLERVEPFTSPDGYKRTNSERLAEVTAVQESPQSVLDVAASHIAALQADYDTGDPFDRPEVSGG